MTGMEYGAAYAPARLEDDRRASQYQAYCPTHQRSSPSKDLLKSNRSSEVSADSLYVAPEDIRHSEDSAINRPPSWIISAIHLQESLPPQSLAAKVPTPEPSPGMRPSIFGTRNFPQEPYQESVAWANSTNFVRNSSANITSPPDQNPTCEAFHGHTRGPSVFTLREHDMNHPRKDSRQYFRHPRRILEPWKMGIWRRFPARGFGALLMIVLLTGASAGIILSSHGRAIDEWKIGRDNAQASVYISVFEMIMNFLTLSALVDGMVMKYWRQMLHGTTLSAMHDTFLSVQLWPAIKRVATLRFNKVAIACVFSSLSFLRGPLFQRSLTFSPTTKTYTISPGPLAVGISLSISSVIATIPLYYGYWELGRTVSLNPLELAKAFGAPLLRGLDGNATPEMITVERGGMSIKYGALERYGEGKDLRVEEMSRTTVRTPWEGEIFG
ncbi:hypothetical protein CC80DRAFT_588845 [Byssothecium circinans]|uniref:Uncharacterized protein n=1 Tax=Byssothecium circinans TaxID=147558 RepID=A0A6A5UC57_9PLEO|nr:hypothetical protein CC80DRAFT_588845 [Byssothecium circinans]